MKTFVKVSGSMTVAQLMQGIMLLTPEQKREIYVKLGQMVRAG